MEAWVVSTAANRCCPWTWKRNTKGGKGQLSLFFIIQGQHEGASYHLATPPALDAWHHVAGVSDSTGTTLYLDGKPVANGRDPMQFGSPAAMIIGANDNGPQRYFDGLIDDVMVFDRALSAIEIRNLSR